MKRILRLDGVRALAFLIILLRHGMGVPMFWAGVDIFFVLSGFLISSILLNSQGKEGAWSHFYERRALRILPPLTLCIVLTTYLFHLHWGFNILWYVFFAMNFAEIFHLGMPALAVLWSLAVEEQFYLFWPIIALRFRPQTVKRVAIGLIILAPLMRGIATPFLHDHWPIYYLMPFRMDLLASGAVLAVCWRNPGPMVRWRRWGLGMMGGGLALFAACVILIPNFHAGGNTITFNTLGYSLICCVATGLITFTLGADQGLWARLMSAKVIRWIGLISYTGYLVHIDFLRLVTPFSSHIGNFMLAVAVTFTYSSVSWVLIEKPILRLRPSAWRKQQKAAVV